MSSVPPLRLGTRRSLMATTQSRMVAARLTELTGRGRRAGRRHHLRRRDQGEPHAARRHGRVRQRAARQADRGRDRLRRPLAEGPADHAGPARGHRGRSRPRDDPRDALVGARPSSPTCRPARRSAPARRAGSPSSGRCGPIWSTSRSAATPTPGSARSPPVSCRRSCSPPPGSDRLGREAEIAQIFEVEEMLPAPGQGALAVECRSDRADLIELLERARRRRGPAPR